MADLMRDIISSSTRPLTTRPTSFPGSKGQGKSDKKYNGSKKNRYKDWLINGILLYPARIGSNDGKPDKATDKAVCRI